MSELINKCKIFCVGKFAYFFLLLNVVVLPFLSEHLLFALLYSFLALAATIYLTYKQFTKDGITTYLLLLFPLFFYVILLLLCRYGRFEISLVNRIFILFSLLGFISLGYLFGKNKKFSISLFLYGFYAVLAVYCLINLIATMANFVPFYGFIYANRSFYYDGQIARESLNYTGVMLLSNGIEFVDLGRYSLFPIMLLSSSTLFLFTSPKQKLKFYSLICFVSIAFFSLLFTVSKFTILFDLLAIVTIAFIILYIKFVKARKTLNIILIVFLVLGVIFTLLFIFNALGNNSLSDFIRDNRLTNYIFNENRFSSAFKNVIYYTSQISFITGFPVRDSYGYFITYPSGNYLVDSFMYTGLFGVLFLIALIALAYYLLYKLGKTNIINRESKALLISVITLYFVYSLLGGSPFRSLFGDELNEFFVEGMFFIIIMLIGYVYSVYYSNIKVTKEQINEKA